MNEKKILMLWPVKTDYWPREIQKLGVVEIDSVYKKTSLAKNIIRKICCLNGKLLDMFVENWKDDILKYDVIIVQASQVTRFIPKYIRSKGFEKRIIYWYWDPVSGSIDPNKLNRDICELWSFDVEDCKKYNLNFNDTYYIFNKNDIKMVKKSERIYNISYVGRDKGRLNYLLNLENEFTKKGLNTFFYLVATKPYSRNAKKLNLPIDYKKVLEIIGFSDAILDVNQENQVGLSMRCMESIFLKRKLITNNKAIRFSKIYNKNNVFIIDEDNNLKDFLDAPYICDNEILKYYTFKNWLDRFF